MTIYFVPSRFNSMPQESRVLGNTFNVYATHTYSGHERVEAMIKHDRRDAELMSIWRYRRAGVEQAYQARRLYTVRFNKDKTFSVVRAVTYSRPPVEK